ncbi:zincin-like metallopeptidase domain-containing protein [Persicobacter diffluens]|uniref:DUF1738 domain-containing protein n=1 Tax=Persicobacter diffluens TaxID=981 RepID=A0AAN4W594_9BACT|nr:hypothetical protein PEDI_54580 [Persicobacter diffluens]
MLTGLAGLGLYAIGKTFQAMSDNKDDFDIYEGLPKISDQRAKKLFGEAGEPLEGLAGLMGLGKTASVREIITQMIIEKIESTKELPWRKAWTSIKTHYLTSEGKPVSLVPMNFDSKQAYKGMNFFMLYFFNRRAIPYYLTFKQIEKRGGNLKKGAKSEVVIYYSSMYKDKDGNTLSRRQYQADPEAEEIRFLKYYRVFNLEDTEGIDHGLVPAPTQSFVGDDIQSANKIISYMPKRPEIFHKGLDQAFYSPDQDTVTMPFFDQFPQKQEYYSVLFHELVHSTKHQNRLDDKKRGGKRFGDPHYAAEELIAEMGAAYLCGEAGILMFTRNNTAAYIQNWKKAILKELKEDNKWILATTAKAQKAVDFILKKGPYQAFHPVNRDGKAVTKQDKSESGAEEKEAKALVKERKALLQKLKSAGIQVSRGEDICSLRKKAKEYDLQLPELERSTNTLAQFGFKTYRKGDDQYLQFRSELNAKALERLTRQLNLVQQEERTFYVNLNTDKGRKAILEAIRFIQREVKAKRPVFKNERSKVAPQGLGKMLQDLRALMLRQKKAGWVHRARGFSAKSKTYHLTFNTISKAEKAILEKIDNGKFSAFQGKQIFEGPMNHSGITVLLGLMKKRPEPAKSKSTSKRKPSAPKKGAKDRKTTGKKSGGYEVRSIPTFKIKTDEKRFQNRFDAVSNESHRRLMKAYNKGDFEWSKFDPIIIWMDPKAKQYFVLSGHTRLGFFKRVGQYDRQFEKIPAKIFKGTEQSAIELALNSNTLSSKETDIERAMYYAALRKKGESPAEVSRKIREAEGKNANTIHNLSYLAPKGFIIGAIASTAGKDPATQNNLMTIANWTGEAKRKYPALSQQNENQIAKWLMEKGYGNRKGQFSSKTKFLEYLSRFNEFGSFPEVINLSKLVTKNPAEMEWETQKADIEKELKSTEKVYREKSTAFYAAANQGRITREKADEMIKPYLDAVGRLKAKLADHSAKKGQARKSGSAQASLFGTKKK